MVGLLLEGIVSSGKTSVIRELQTRKRWVERSSKLILSDLFTVRANEHLRSRNERTYRTLMRQNLDVLEAAHEIEIASQLASPGSGRDLAYVLERFHISNAIDYADGNFEAYRDIDATLATLGCRGVVLTVPDMFAGARIRETFERRGPRWKAYCEKLEARVGDVGRHFLAKQEQIKAGARWSSMEFRVIETTERDWRMAVDAVLEFWRI